MGQILSISINNEVQNAACQSVVMVEKNKGLPIVKSASYVDPADIGKLAEKHTLKVACAYDSIIVENVDIPFVNNEKSKILLLKNKMKDRLRKELEYSFAYFENPGKAEPPNVNYTVYAAPVFVLKDEIKIPLKKLSSVKSFTFDFFAIAGVSAAAEPKESIFHVYANKDRIIIVLSTGKKVEYYRASNVPSQINTPEALNSFYYENINLTYLYVRQNFSSLKMKVVLSGKIYDDTAFAESLRTFIDLPMITISAKSIVAGVTDKQFHEFLIPIGHSLLKGALDFSSDTQLADRIFSKLVVGINCLLILGILGVLGYSFKRYEVYVNAQARLDRSSKAFLNRQVAFVNKMGNAKELSGKARYLQLLAEQKSSPLILLAPSQDIMNFYLFDRVEFSGLGDAASVTFSGEKPQDSYASLEEFRRTMQDKINQVTENHVKYTDQSLHNLMQLRNSMRVIITPGNYLEQQTLQKEQNTTGPAGGNAKNAANQGVGQ